MKNILIIILILGTAGSLYKKFGGPKPPQEVVEQDFDYIIVGRATGSMEKIYRPTEWVEGNFSGKSKQGARIIGGYRTRITSFTVERLPKKTDESGKRVYPVKINRVVEREYSAGDVDLSVALDLLPKHENRIIECSYFKTEDDKWEHTPEKVSSQ